MIASRKSLAAINGHSGIVLNCNYIQFHASDIHACTTIWKES